MSVDSVRAAWPLFQEAGGGSIPTSTLQLHIYEISAERAIALNGYWHSVLPIANFVFAPMNAFYGAEYSGNFYAVAIWSDPIAANRMTDGRNILELRRFAISPDAPRNTASRMLGVMARLLKRKFPNLVRLISYQSVDHHDGTIYKAAGWTPVSYSEFIDWDAPRRGRKRPKQQIESSKVRWERNLV